MLPTHLTPDAVREMLGRVRVDAARERSAAIDDARRERRAAANASIAGVTGASAAARRRAGGASGPRRRSPPRPRRRRSAEPPRPGSTRARRMEKENESVGAAAAAAGKRAARVVGLPGIRGTGGGVRARGRGSPLGRPRRLRVRSVRRRRSGGARRRGTRGVRARGTRGIPSRARGFLRAARARGAGEEARDAGSAWDVARRSVLPRYRCGGPIQTRGGVVARSFIDTTRRPLARGRLLVLRI